MTRISTAISWVNIDGSQKAAILAQVGHFYFGAGGQFHIGANIFAQRLQKPCLVVQPDAVIGQDNAARVLAWLRAQHVGTLNVAGPRESKRPGMHAATLALLQAVHALAGCQR